MVTTGFAPFDGYQTWYQVVGELGGSRRPLVILHGGPGATHSYMTAFEDLWTNFDIPVVLYDQIGCGKSTWLPEKGIEYFTFDHFLAELESLLRYLNISEYDLLGHSWGGMLAAEQAIRQPTGLKHVILASSPADSPLAISEINRLLKGLPQDVQDTIKKHEKQGTTDSPEYKAAARIFFAKHVCRLSPFPKPLQESGMAIRDNPHVYRILQGPSEFHVTGPIKDWSAVSRLSFIKAKALVINGKFDEMTDANAVVYHKGIAGAKWVKFNESAHMTFWEEREKCVDTVGAFLQDAL